MIDRHIYYPDRGWQYKWAFALFVFLSGLGAFLYLVSQP